MVVFQLRGISTDDGIIVIVDWDTIANLLLPGTVITFGLGEMELRLITLDFQNLSRNAFAAENMYMIINVLVHNHEMYITVMTYSGEIGHVGKPYMLNVALSIVFNAKHAESIEH